jgi:hypothetical protein
MPVKHRANRVQAILEGGHHTGIVPGPADTSEEILVLSGAGRVQLPVGCKDVYRQQIVDGEAVFAAEPALPAAEG